jgi:hypothetical protein
MLFTEQNIEGNRPFNFESFYVDLPLMRIGHQNQPKRFKHEGLQLRDSAHCEVLIELSIEESTVDIFDLMRLSLGKIAFFTDDTSQRLSLPSFLITERLPFFASSRTCKACAVKMCVSLTRRTKAVCNR